MDTYREILEDHPLPRVQVASRNAAYNNKLSVYAYKGVFQPLPRAMILTDNNILNTLFIFFQLFLFAFQTEIGGECLALIYVADYVSASQLKANTSLNHVDRENVD